MIEVSRLGDCENQMKIVFVLEQYHSRHVQFILDRKLDRCFVRGWEKWDAAQCSKITVE